MLISSNHLCDVNESKSMLGKEFEIYDLGPTKKILGMDIHKDRRSKKLWLSQQGNVEKMLDRFGMSITKPVSTPLANYFKLFID